MANYGRFAEGGNSAAGTGEARAEMRTENQKQDSPSMSAEIGNPQPAQKKVGIVRYPDMQSAVRFPIKLPVALKSKSGDNLAETQNISANGVLFQVDSEMPIGSLVDFTISLPAEVVGTEADVQIDCRGRVVRNFEEDGRRRVGVVIDEYRFERR
jgi:PilZ domain-containing protein